MTGPAHPLDATPELLEPAPDLDDEVQPLGYWDYMQARVYEDPDQPEVQGPPLAGAQPPAAALAALRSLNTGPAAVSEQQEGGSSSPVIAERAAAAVDPGTYQDAEDDDFEGYGEESTCAAGELEPGDLAQVDPDGGWVVITEYPEADGDDVYLEYTDRFTGEPATCTISAQEMVPTMHVMQEEN